MSGIIDSRLSRLEATIGHKKQCRSHLVEGGAYTFGDDDGKARAKAEGDERVAELIRQEEASPDDNFLVYLIVDPRANLEARLAQ
jgi:hypothetical protein